jgi:hypothetical protein
VAETDLIDDEHTEGAQAAPSGVSGDSGTTTAPKEDMRRFAGMGPLLQETDHEKVVKACQQFVMDDLRSRKRRRAVCERNRLWVKGVRGVELRRTSEDRDDVELYVPLGAYDVPPIMDRTDELLEKRVSHLVSDPAVPEAEPASEQDEDRDGAEFTTRLLTTEGGEAGWNMQGLTRRAIRKASIYQSSFTYWCVDPKGGGYRPTEIRATKQAKTIADAETIIDPTGKTRLAKDAELSTRYIRTDENGIKTIVDDPNIADPQAKPSIRPETVTSENVVFIPRTCSGIGDADGVAFIRPTTWGRLVSSFPWLESISEDEKREIVNWDPEDSKNAQPRHAKETPISGQSADEEKVKDTDPVKTLVVYMLGRGAYRKGAYIICAGPKRVLHRDFHQGAVVGKQKNQLVDEPLHLPFSQMRDLDDDIDDDPHGRATAEKLGPADEIRGDIVLSWIDYIERFTRPHTFLPVGSIIQPGQLAARTGDAVLYNPQGLPVVEQVPQFPADAKEFFDRAGESQDSRSMLEATAQGVDSANSVSGVAKDRVIQQAHVNLTSTRANASDYIERSWRIVTQLYRVYWTIPDMLKIVGDDGGYKYQEWTRADLGSTRDIKIAKGSFSQQSPEEKQEQLDARYAVRDAQGQPMLMSTEEYIRLSASNLKARLGIQDNPHRLRVRRQLHAFRKGPADEEQFAQDVAAYEQLQQQFAEAEAAIAAMQPPVAPAPAPVDPAAPAPAPAPAPGEAPLSAGGPAVPGSDPLSSAPAPVAPPALPPLPPDPVADQNPFLDQLPIDDEQAIALQRHAELSAEMAGTGFTRKHPRWQQFLLDEYARAKTAAGVMTVPEQQQQAADAANAQSEQQMKLEQMKVDGQRAMHTENLRAKAAESEHKTQLDDAQRAADKEEADAQRAHEANDTALRSAGADLTGKPTESTARNTTL